MKFIGCFVLLVLLFTMHSYIFAEETNLKNLIKSKIDNKATSEHFFNCKVDSMQDICQSRCCEQTFQGWFCRDATSCAHLIPTYELCEFCESECCANVGGVVDCTSAFYCKRLDRDND